MAAKDDDKVGAPKTEKAPGDVELGGSGHRAKPDDAAPSGGGGGPGGGLTGAGTVRGGSTVPPEEAPQEPGTVKVAPPGSSPPIVDARGQPNEALLPPKEDAEAEAKKQPRDGGYQSTTG